MGFESVARSIANTLPRSRVLYRACRLYIQSYVGDGDSDIHRNGELQFLQQALPKCEVVFDVGANVGEWTAVAKELKPSLEVHSFEPSAAAYKKLAAAALPGVVCNHMGLSSSPGELKLQMYGDSSGCNSLYTRGVLGKAAREEVVRLDTVDAYCERTEIRRIDLLKIDVEGHELSVLQGAERMIGEKRIRMLQLEYGGTYIDSGIFLRQVFDFLLPRGYVAHKLTRRGMEAHKEYSQLLETFTLSNWVFVESGQSI